MTRILFLPNPNTLLWLESEQPAEVILEQIQKGEWIAPAPFDHLPSRHYSAACQDGVVIITNAILKTVVTSQIPFPPLNRRQSEVLKDLAAGFTSRRIARRLQLTQRMVAYYIAELKIIFQAQTRAELVSKSKGVQYRQDDSLVED